MPTAPKRIQEMISSLVLEIAERQKLRQAVRRGCMMINGKRAAHRGYFPLKYCFGSFMGRCSSATEFEGATPLK